MAQCPNIALSNATTKLLETFQELAKLTESSKQILIKFHSSSNFPYTRENLFVYNNVLHNLQSLAWKQKSALLTAETLTEYLLKTIVVPQIQISAPAPPPVDPKKPRKNRKKIPVPPKDQLATLVDSCGIGEEPPNDFDLPSDYQQYATYSLQY